MGKKRGAEISKEQIEISRIKVPRKGEILAVIEIMLGADRVRAKCADGHVRVCRIPGRLRKRVWMRPGDLILVKPWVVQSDERADVVYRYTGTQANWLKRKGYVEGISLD
jgi:translation initiation factor 1A